MREEWREIEGADGYFVSSCGSVKHWNKVLKQHPNNVGYLMVRIHGRTRLVHRLVGEAFIPGHDDIDHIDGDKTNNCVVNLERVSKSENMRRAADRYKPPCGIPSPVIGSFGGFKVTFASVRAAARFIGRSHQAVSIAASRGRTCAGVRWQYAE